MADPGGWLRPAARGRLRLELRLWETLYNTIRPDQALGYLTPAQVLESLQARVQRTTERITAR